MKIGIIGVGSLGLLWAARLFSKGSVMLLCRTSKQASVINQSGIKLVTRTGIRQTYQVKAEWIEDAYYSAPFDVLFLMVKQPALTDILALLPRLMHDKTHVVAWQNGLGHIEKLQQFKHPYVYVAVTTEGAYRLSTNEVHHTGAGETKLGNVEGMQVSDEFRSFLATIGVESTNETIKMVMWKKFAINCVINPLTALLEVPNGKLLNPEIETIMHRLIQELCLIANHKKIPLEFDEISKLLTDVCKNTASNYSSMLQDIRAKRPTEIDALNQKVVDYSLEIGVPVPYHQFITKLIRAKSLLSI